MRELARSRLQILGRDDLIRQAVAVSFSGVKQASGHEQITGDLMPDLHHQERRNDGGNEADAYFGVSEFGLRDGESEVTHGRDTGAARNGRTVDRGNGRLGEIVDP